MSKKSLITIAVFGAIVIGLTIGKGQSSPMTQQRPVIVASFHMRGITQGIPTTTIFTPKDTGVFRVSFYSGMTTPGNSESSWFLNLNWTDDAGQETTQLSYLNSSQIPPVAYEQNPQFQGGPISPWVFEAVAGQPITFSMPTNGGAQPGTCALAITVERLQ